LSRSKGSSDNGVGEASIAAARTNKTGLSERPAGIRPWISLTAETSHLERGKAMQTAIKTAPVSNTSLWAGRALSGLFILFMLFDSSIKLVPLDVVTESSAQLGLPTGVNFARTLGTIGLVCTILYAYPRTAVLGAILLTAYMGGTVATHLRIGSPLFSHTLFGVYLGIMLWGGLYLRNPRVRALIPFSRQA
jgi:hypothetical protein